MSRFEKYLTEGWGAGAQKREQDQFKQEWTVVLDKYAHDKIMSAKLKDLRVKNWKASAAVTELGLK